MVLARKDMGMAQGWAGCEVLQRVLFSRMSLGSRANLGFSEWFIRGRAYRQGW